MSKKKKSIMDGYFDQPNTDIEINPFVEEFKLSEQNNSSKLLELS